MEELKNIISHMGDHAYKAGLTDDTKAQYYTSLNHLTNESVWRKVKDNFIEGAPPYKGMPTIKSMKANYYNLLPQRDIAEHECMYCNSKGLLTALDFHDAEYLVCCNCANGEAMHRKTQIPRYEHEKHNLKNPLDIQLTEKETQIYNRLKKLGVKETIKDMV